MRKFSWKICLLFTISTWATEASSCGFASNFFSESEEGSIAHIADAASESQARRLYSNWCDVKNSLIIKSYGTKSFFAINNRSHTAKQPRFYIVKIFKRSQATLLRPVISLRRIGTWKDGDCRFSMFSQKTKYGDLFTSYQPDPISEFSFQMQDRPMGCTYMNAWMGSAYGASHLDISNFKSLMRSIPSKVNGNHRQSWSLIISATSYGTVGYDISNSGFPLLSINRGDADEMIVQYFDSENRFIQFEIDWTR